MSTWPVSEDFKSALRQGHVAISKAERLDSNGQVAEELDILSGSVSVDRNRKVRRTCDIEIAVDQQRVPSRKSYAGTVLDSRPIAYWRLGEDRGTVARDQTGNEYHGTYKGGITLNADGALVEDRNAAVELDGSSTYPRVVISNANFLPYIRPYAIEAWFTKSNTSNGGLISFAGRDQNNALLVFVGDTSTSVYNGGASHTFSHDSVISNGWHHILISFDGTTTYFYLDGDEVGTSTSLGGIVDPGLDRTLVFGQEQDEPDGGYTTAQHIVGKIDEVALYDHNVPADEVSLHYIAGTGRLTTTITYPDVPTQITDNLAPGGAEIKLSRGVRLPQDVKSYAGEVLADNPTGYWRFDETSGSVANDSSGNGNHGTYTTVELDVQGALLGDSNTAVRLNSAGERVNDCGITSWTADFTGEAWIHRAVDENTGAHRILWAGSLSSNAGWSLYIGGADSSLRLQVNDGTTHVTYNTGLVPADRQWAHVAVKRFDNVFTVFLNGVPRWSQNISVGDLSSSYELRIGGSVHDSQSFVGKIDEAAVWHHLALADSNIKRHYDVGRQKLAKYTEEYAPIGVFRITNTSVVDDGSGDVRLRIRGRDRSETIRRARFSDTYVISAGTNYATAIENIITSRTSFTQFSFLDTSRTTPRIVAESGDDPWELCQEMASSLGAIIYFNQSGVCVLESEPDPAEAPTDFVFAEGEDATILNAESLLSSDRTYNHVVVVGEGTGILVPVRAEARDLDVDSPTYVFGSFGDVPVFKTTELVTTEAQAQDAADAMLRKVLGLTRQVRWETIPTPHLDVGAVVEIQVTSVRVNRRVVIESFQIPLEPGGVQSMTSRERRT